MPCSRKQQGAFDGARTQDPHITRQTYNPLSHAAPVIISTGRSDLRGVFFFLSNSEFQKDKA